MVSSPHTRRLEDDPPVALAKQAIARLQQRLNDDFGVTVRMGAEQEFCALTRQWSDDEANPFGLMHGGEKIAGVSASVSRPAAQRDPFFPESRRVNRSYREVGSESYWHQLEVVLSHEPADADGTPAPASPLILARSIEAVRHQLVMVANGHHRGGSVATAQQRYLRDLKQNHVELLRLAPHIDGTNVFNGMHINLSLVDDNGQNLLNDKDSLKDVCAARRHHFSASIGAMHDENLYLLGSDHRSLERLRTIYDRTMQQHQLTYSSMVIPRDHELSNNHYLENQIAGSLSNPYYAVMLNLAGIYRALAHESSNVPPLESKCQRDFRTLSAAPLMSQFHEGRVLRDLLNEMEPHLGDRFYNAIDRYPPGVEKTMQQKRHEQGGSVNR